MTSTHYPFPGRMMAAPTAIRSKLPVTQPLPPRSIRLPYRHPVLPWHRPRPPRRGPCRCPTTSSITGGSSPRIAVAPPFRRRINFKRPASPFYRSSNAHQPSREDLRSCHYTNISVPPVKTPLNSCARPPRPMKRPATPLVANHRRNGCSRSSPAVSRAKAARRPCPCPCQWLAAVVVVGLAAVIIELCK